MQCARRRDCLRPSYTCCSCTCLPQVMEGSELRLEIQNMQQEHSSTLAATRAAADERAATQDSLISSLQSELSTRQLLLDAADERATDHSKQLTALQHRLGESTIAVQQSERLHEEVNRARQAWAHEREALHQGLEAARAACSEHMQKLQSCDDSSQLQAQQIQQLRLDLQHEQDAKASVEHELQLNTEQVCPGRRDGLLSCYRSNILTTVLGSSVSNIPRNASICMSQTMELRHEVHELHAKLEQQERALGGAQQSARTAQEQLSTLREDNAALRLRKAEVDQLQNLHAEHAHIYRQDTSLIHCLGMRLTPYH